MQYSLQYGNRCIKPLRVDFSDFCSVMFKKPLHIFVVRNLERSGFTYSVGLLFDLMLKILFCRKACFTGDQSCSSPLCAKR